MNTLNLSRKLILAVAATFAAGLLFVNVYNSVVDVPNWGHELPRSIEVSRSYFAAATPGTFFRLFSPINQLVGLLALALCWKAGPRVRLLAGLALLVSIGSDALTFGFFYPRNDILFGGPLANLDAIRDALTQWAAMNWVRSAGVALNVALDFGALFLLAGSERS